VKAAWAACVTAAEAGSLSALRPLGDVEVCLRDESIWAAGPRFDEVINDRLRKVSGARRFSVDERGRITPFGSQVPTGLLPEGTWIPIREFLRPEPQAAAFAGLSEIKTPVQMIRQFRESDPNLLIADKDAWVDYSCACSSIRLSSLRFAACGDGRVLIAGRPLPVLMGTAYVQVGRLGVPCGWCWDPPVDHSVLEDLFEVGGDDLVLLHSDGTAERIGSESFVAASRSAARLTARMGDDA